METVGYKAFGAVGDGVHDDAAAIAAAHAYANEHGLNVKSEEGSAFYLSQVNEPIVIKTNTDWTGSKFILDDRNVTQAQRGEHIYTNRRTDHIFYVEPSKGSYKLEGIAPPKRYQKNLGITLPEPSVILLCDETQIRYIRSGGDANNGFAQNEVIVVDRDGNIDDMSPVIWDYNEVSSAEVIPIDQETLTIKGGHFTTIAPQKVVGRSYYGRGIKISRSNVVVEGFEHYVENEDEMGSPYDGIFSIGRCCNVTLRDCILTPRLYFRFDLPDGRPYGQGTYEITARNVASLTFENCRQTIDILDSRYWGIMGTSYCKNMVLRGCVFSRFDAHQGVANVSIYSCRLGYQGVETIGIGTVRVEDSELYGHNLIVLRPDYGSSWEGDIVIKNCRWTPSFCRPITSLRPVIGGSNKEDHDYGYPCHMPHTITVDGLYIDDSRTEGNGGITILAAFNPEHTSPEYEEKVKADGLLYNVTKTLKLKNITTATGKKPITLANEFMFRNTEIIEE